MVLKGYLVMPHYKWTSLEKLHLLFVIKNWFVELEVL